MELDIQPLSENDSVLGYIGSVEDVIAGRINPDLLTKRYHARDYECGFEIASPRDFNYLGDSVMCHDMLYTYNPNQSDAQFRQCIYGEEFVTSGIFLIPKTATPTHTLAQTFAKPIEIGQFYEELYTHCQAPVAVSGIIEYANLNVTGIGRPPIHNENIFENKEIYYPYENTRLKNKSAFIVACMTDFNERKFHDINQSLKIVLYHNPLDVQTGLNSHTHLITLHSRVEDAKQITPEQVDNCYHMFVDDTLVTSVNLKIYRIAALEDLA